MPPTQKSTTRPSVATNTDVPTTSANSTSTPHLDQLAKSFEPAALEAKASALWQDLHIARAGYRGTGAAQANAPAFAIQLPPPNVTGTLHMGHAFNQTIMDSLTRYHRMCGYNTVWLPGTDHAGIATQIVVERQLQEAGGPTRHDLGRSGFIAKVHEWKETSGNTITQQMRRIGASVDWSREYFTMDAPRSKAVTETFVQLYRQGLIYRGKRLVNWDPVLQTAVSDLEVESEEEEGFLWHIAYPLADGSGHVVVATTRPETMLGDVAVMVHPDDARYAHLVGQQVTLPLVGRSLTIIADACVDSSFGTGVVKVTPAHDANDYAVGQRHALPLIGILNFDASINDLAPQKYRGLDRFAARQVIVDELQALGLLVEVKKHVLKIPRCTRTAQVVEPMLTDQWFVAMNQAAGPDGKSLAQRALDVAERGQLRFYPENWINTYRQWLAHIQDWCISRQLWWGHQIPAWYDADGNVYVAQSQAQAQAQAPGKALTRDPDVLDTWYSSALLPFSTLGWDGHTAHQADSDLALYLPSSVLVTGYDILFFWVARMVMLTLHFTGKLPFKDVYIHGLVRDAQGQKMSKSEGNVLDPVDLIDGIALPELLHKRSQGLRRPETAPTVRRNTEKEFPMGIPAFGADALRFTFASLASLGRNINFDSRRCEGYRNFCNKLWNASRFVLMHCEGQDCQTEADIAPPSVIDRWIISLLQDLKQQVASAFASYRLDLAAAALYDFVWNEFCDWYLEMSKVPLQQGSDVQRIATRRTLIRTLETLLRLLHPLTPYITEALWQHVAAVAGRFGPSISIAPYPKAAPERIDPAAQASVERLKAIVDAARNLRGTLQLNPSQRLPLLVLAHQPNAAHAAADDVQSFMQQHQTVLQSLVRASAVQVLTSAQWQGAVGHAPVALAGGLSLCLQVTIDVAAEKARLRKEIAKRQAEVQKANDKLNNPAFVERAPAKVLAQEQQRQAQFEQQLAQLQQRLESLG